MYYEVLTDKIKYINKAGKTVRGVKGSEIFIRNRLQARELLATKKVKLINVINEKIDKKQNKENTENQNEKVPDGSYEIDSVVTIEHEGNKVNATITKINPKSIKVSLPDGEEITIKKDRIVEVL